MAANPSTHIRNIAIVGATGQLGKYIAAELLKNPTFTVTALTRTADTSSFPPGIQAIPVDYSDPSTLTAALKGQDALIITLAVTAPPDTHAKLVHAAAKTWRRLNGENQLPKVVQGVKFQNGIEVIEMPVHHAA